MMIVSARPFFVLYLLASTARTFAQTPIPQLDLSGIVQREVAILQICAGSKLTLLEQKQAALTALQSLKTDRVQALRDDADAVTILKHINEPAYVAEVRQGCRANSEFGQAKAADLQFAFLAEGAIIKAHDPTVASDPATKHLLTRHTFEVLENRATLLAREHGLPLPDGTFRAEAERRLRANLATMPADQANWYINIERNSAYMEAGLSMVPAAIRASTDQSMKANFVGKAPADIQWTLAANVARISYDAREIVMSKTSLAGNAATRAQLQTLLMQQQMNNRQMQQNGYQLSHPGCGIGGNADMQQCAMDSPRSQPLMIPLIPPPH